MLYVAALTGNVLVDAGSRDETNRPLWICAISAPANWICWWGKSHLDHEGVLSKQTVCMCVCVCGYLGFCVGECGVCVQVYAFSVCTFPCILYILHNFIVFLHGILFPAYLYQFEGDSSCFVCCMASLKIQPPYRIMIHAKHHIRPVCMHTQQLRAPI